MNDSEVSRALGIHVSAVNRMRKKDFKPFKTNARYWSEMKKRFGVVLWNIVVIVDISKQIGYLFTTWIVWSF